MDTKFVKEAAQGGLAEVALGNVAKSNGSNDAVKQFGDRMVTDHSKANDELKSLAQQKGWTLPTDPKPADKAKQDRLSKLNGAQFDKAYMRDMVQDHQKDVKQFQKCASSCKDPDLKAWAGKTAPILQDHLKMAQDSAKQVGAMNGGKSKKSSSSDASSGKPSGALQ
jgi:putative membrane protein